MRRGYHYEITERGEIIEVKNPVKPSPYIVEMDEKEKERFNRECKMGQAEWEHFHNLERQSYWATIPIDKFFSMLEKGEIRP